jgi:hypothetical protein
MQKTKSIFLAALMTTSLGLFAEEAKKTDKPEFNFSCQADREFITTYEYLKHKKDFGLKPEDMRNIAVAVTKGCTGAASSFIESLELLLKTGVDGKTSIEQARDIAIKGENFAKAFVAIYRGAFAKEFLDMDTGTAIRIARKLTSDFTGDPKVAADDYFDLAKFCVSTKKLDLPRPTCATMAARIAGYSADSKMPVAKSFINAVNYLTQNKDINLSMHDALELAESLVAVSPEAFPIFINTYEYASEKSGLELTRADAIKFAKAVSMNTKQPKPM